MGHQDEKWGWPRPTEFLDDDQAHRRDAISIPELFGKCEARARFLLFSGRPCWQAILGEELGEVARETDPEKRIVELIQVAAVALSWAQAIQSEGKSDGCGLEAER